MVGRSAELAMLEEGLRSAHGGRPQLVVVAGDAGVGKTRLVREVARRAGGRGWTALVGRCVQLSDGATVLAPLAEVVRQLSEDRGGEALLGTLDESARWLARLVPDLVGDGDGLDGAGPAQLFLAFHQVLRELADEHPVLLVLEDLHWADSSTRDLVRHLAAHLERERLLVVATVRTDDLGRDHPLKQVLAEVIRRPQVLRVDLGPLAPDDMLAHVTALADGELDDARLRAVVERAQGNPFYAEQLLRSSGDGLPPTLADVLQQRLDRLSADCRQLLREAAVLGEDVDAILLAEVTRLGEAAARTAARAALEDGILVTDGRSYTFRHALLREVALASMLPGDRVATHAAAAAVIEARPDLAVGGRASASGQAAHHWRAARDLPRCLAASVAAIDEAMRLLAAGEALRHADRAIELWDRVADPEAVTGVTRSELLFLAARAALARGDTAFRGLRREAILAADADGDDLLRTHAISLITAQLDGGRERELLTALDEERARHADDGTASSSLVLAAHASVVVVAADRRGEPWDIDAVAADLDLAAEIARRSGDWRAQLVAQTHIAERLGPYVPGRYDAALSNLRTLAAEPRGVSRAELERGFHHIDYVAAVTPYFCGDMGRAAVEFARSRPSPSGTADIGWLWQWAMANELDVWAGRVEDAARRIDEADSRNHDGGELMSTFLAAYAGDVLRWTGQVERARRRAAIAEARGGLGSIFLAAEVAASRAATGAPPRRVMAAAVELAESFGADNWHLWLSKLVAAVATAAEDGPIDDDLLEGVDHLIGRHRRYVAWLPEDAPILPWMRACLQRAEAERAFLAGAPDPALWDPVVDYFDERGGVPHAALARLRRAVARASVDGASPSCEEDLVASWRVCSDLGLTALAEAAAVLARRLRVRLPGSVRDRDGADLLDTLTDREREVVLLVARGWSNRQVGEHLFISPKTVSAHLSNAMRKLDVDSRTAASLLVHRAGLLPE